MQSSLEGNLTGIIVSNYMSTVNRMVIHVKINFTENIVFKE